MNDNASLALSLPRTNLGGLPQRLVQDGVVEEPGMHAALQAATERKTSFVTQLISAGTAKARDIAIAASAEYGVPLFDLDALSRRSRGRSHRLRQAAGQASRAAAVQARQAAVPRGRRSHQSARDRRDQVPDRLAVEAIVVEDDKLQKMLDKAIEQVDTQMPNLGDEEGVDLESLEVTGGDEEAGGEVGRDDVEDAPIVRFVNKVLLDAIRRGASDIHFEPYEKMFRVRFRMDGVLKEIAQPPVQLTGKIAARLKVMARLDIAERRVPQDGRIKMRLSKTRAIDFRVSTCPTLYGEKIVTAYPRSLAGDARHRGARLRAVPEGPVSQAPGQAAGHDPGDRPDRQRQDRLAVHRPQHPQSRRHQHLHGRGSGRNQSARRQPGQRQQQGRPDLRLGAARLPAPGPGRGHGRRDARPGDRRDRDQGRADRTPGALDAAHQRCAADAHAPGRHGREALRDRDLREPDHRAAAGAPAVRALQAAARRAAPRRCARKASRRPTSPPA